MRLPVVLAICLASATASAEERAWKQVRSTAPERATLHRLKDEATRFLRKDPRASRLVGLMQQHGLGQVYLRDLKNGVQRDSKLVVTRGLFGRLSLREAYEPSRLSSSIYVTPGWTSAGFGRFSISGLRGLTLTEIEQAVEEAADAIAADPKSRTLEAQLPGPEL